MKRPASVTIEMSYPCERGRIKAEDLACFVALIREAFVVEPSPPLSPCDLFHLSPHEAAVEMNMAKSQPMETTLPAQRIDASDIQRRNVARAADACILSSRRFCLS